MDSGGESDLILREGLSDFVAWLFTLLGMVVLEDATLEIS